MPIRSLRGTTDDVTEALQYSLYVEELQQQARVASRCLARAWVAGRAPADGRDDDGIWADLQAMLFACIVIQRILRPSLSQIRPRGGRSKAECQDWARQRSRALHRLLDIDEAEAALFDVGGIRDPLEHIDEQLDGLVLGGSSCVSDRYVSSGVILVGVDEDDYPSRAFRVFIPDGGYLRFGSKMLDLFALDHALSVLRVEALPDAAAQLERRITGRNYFGGQLVSDISDPQSWPGRVETFLARRRTLGEPLD